MGSRDGAVAVVFAAILATVLAASIPTAAAHETEDFDDISITVGWADEPAYAGLPNAVDVIVENAADDAEIVLSVEVRFGDDVLGLELEPTADDGRFAADVWPTVPGVYSFHVAGRVDTTIIDLTSECSPTTFDCVREAADIQVPPAPPADRSTAQRLDREVTRLNSRIDDSEEPSLLAMTAVGLAAAALVTALWSIAKRR